MRAWDSPTEGVYTPPSLERRVIDNVWASKRGMVKSVFGMTSDLLPSGQTRDVKAVGRASPYMGLPDYVLRIAEEHERDDIEAVQFWALLQGGHDEDVSP